jgi:predicted DNA-binding transcriptional regulator AlpA
MLRESEAARLLAVSAETLGAWRQARKGPPYTRLGSAIRYPEAALLRWVELQTVTAEAHR